VVTGGPGDGGRAGGGGMKRNQCMQAQQRASGVVSLPLEVIVLLQHIGIKTHPSHL